MATITVEQGSKVGAWRGEDGSYPATLTSVEKRGPFPSKQEPGETFELYEWAFAIEGAPDDACMVWASSSTKISPKSKAYGYLVALFGGKQPPVGTTLDIETQLVGRAALVTVYNDPSSGFTEVTQVTPMPKAPAAKPLRQQVATSDEPF